MWAGTINLDVDGWLVGVEYDTAETAAAIEARCRRWLSDDHRPIEAAFGIRTAPVGCAAGASVSSTTAPRSASGRPISPLPSTSSPPSSPIVTREVGDHQVSVPLRVFVSGSRAVLVDVPPLARHRRPSAAQAGDRRGADVARRSSSAATVGGSWARMPISSASSSGRPLPATTADDAPAPPVVDGRRRPGGWAAVLDRLDDSQLVLERGRRASGSAACWRHDRIRRRHLVRRHIAMGSRPGLGAEPSPRRLGCSAGPDRARSNPSTAPCASPSSSSTSRRPGS